MNTMKMAAIYTRVSSEQQKKEQTIASQTAALRRHAKTHGLSVPEDWIFEDEGYSGATLARPGLDRVRDLAAEGRIDAVLVHSPDRLSRKYPYQVLLVEELQSHGVDVVFVNMPRAETPEDELMLQFHGMISEYERAQIRERCRRGKRHHAQRGSINVMSGAPYGYRYLRRSEPGDARWEVIEAEASVVRRVFRQFLEDKLSINAIARSLNADAVPTRRGAAQWCRSTVWGILQNEAYSGTAYFGKTRTATRQRITRALRMRGGYSSRQARADAPREDWVAIPVPALIDPACFAAAREQLERNRRSPSRQVREPSLLQGMTVCEQCGHSYYRTSTRTSKRKLYYYRCLGSDRYRWPDGARCDSRPVRQDHLDDVVWTSLVGLMCDPALIHRELAQRIETARKEAPETRRMASLDEERQRLRQQLSRLLDAYQESVIELDELRSRRTALSGRLKSIEAEFLAASTAAEEHRRALLLAETAETFLSRIAESADTADIEQRRKVLKLLVKDIVVGNDTITIKHCIPAGSGATGPSDSGPSAPGGKSYQLWKRSAVTASVQHLHAPLHSGLEEAGLRPALRCGDRRLR